MKLFHKVIFVVLDINDEPSDIITAQYSTETRLQIDLEASLNMFYSRFGSRTQILIYTEQDVRYYWPVRWPSSD